MRLRFDSPAESVHSLFLLLLSLIPLTLAVYIGLYVFAPQRLYDTAISLERLRGGLHRAELDIPGFHIVYLSGGPAGAPPLLLLHGLGANKDSWTRLGALTHLYRVYAVDLPGFGESSKPADAGYSIDDQLPRVEAIAKALGLPTFDLGGSSMGGWIAGAYANAHPEQVRSLLLLDPGGVSTAQDSEMIRRLKAGEPLPILARTPAGFPAVLRFVMQRVPFIPAPVSAVLAREQAAHYALNRAIFDQLRQSRPLDTLLAARAAPLTTPTLIVWGTQDRVLDVSGADLLHRLLPNSVVVKLSGVGHLPMLEAPGDVVRDYVTFRNAQSKPG